MSGGDFWCRTISDPCVLWQEIGIGDGASIFISTFRLGAPVDTAIPMYRVGLAIDGPSGFVIE